MIDLSRKTVYAMIFPFQYSSCQPLSQKGVMRQAKPTTAHGVGGGSWLPGTKQAGAKAAPQAAKLGNYGAKSVEQPKIPCQNG